MIEIGRSLKTESSPHCHLYLCMGEAKQFRCGMQVNLGND